MNLLRICNVLRLSKGEKTSLPRLDLDLKIGQPVYVRSPKDTTGLYKVRVMSFDKDTVCVLHPRGQSYEFVPNDKDHILLELPKAVPSERMAVA
jgi:hypothetical protein